MFSFDQGVLDCTDKYLKPNTLLWNIIRKCGRLTRSTQTRQARNEIVLNSLQYFVEFISFHSLLLLNYRTCGSEIFLYTLTIVTQYEGDYKF
jgi:hypothetical protein